MVNGYYDATQAWTPAAKTDSTKANPGEAIVLGEHDDQATATAKLLIQRGALGDPDVSASDASAAAVYSNAVSETATALRALEADGDLTSEGRTKRAKELIRATKAKLDAGTALAEALEADADSLERSAQDLWKDETLTESELSYAMAAVREEARKDPRKFAGKLIETAAKPRDGMRKADATLIEAVLKSHDLGVPLVEPFVMKGVWDQLRRQHPAVDRIDGSRRRAAAVRSVVGASKSAIATQMRQFGVDFDNE